MYITYTGTGTNKETYTCIIPIRVQKQTRKHLLKRYDALVRFCEEYDMVINEDKTKFMVINGVMEDRMSFRKGGLTIKHTDTYVYLGSSFSVKGCIATDIQDHANLQQKHLNKFNVFCFKNQSMPFSYKMMVFESVLTTKLIYGCEAWFTEDYHVIDAMYMNAIKALLGVRKQTPNDVVLTECGVSTLKERIRTRQQNFINSKLIDPEEPLTIVYNLCLQNNTAAFRCLQRALEFSCDASDRRHQSMLESTKTKTVTYKSINPSFSVHSMYRATDKYVADYRRTEMTRFRVGSHRLKVETGRWSRVPREERTCLCPVGGVQDEEHVVFHCGFTKDLREKYEVGDSKTLVDVLEDVECIDFIYEIMKRFK